MAAVAAPDPTPAPTLAPVSLPRVARLLKAPLPSRCAAQTGPAADVDSWPRAPVAPDFGTEDHNALRTGLLQLRVRGQCPDLFGSSALRLPVVGPVLEIPVSQRNATHRADAVEDHVKAAVLPGQQCVLG